MSFEQTEWVWMNGRIVRGGGLLTNDDHSSILLGVTRDAVIQIARDLGYRVEVGVIRLNDLMDADEAFFTGMAALNARSRFL